MSKLFSVTVNSSGQRSYREADNAEQKILGIMEGMCLGACSALSSLAIHVLALSDPILSAMCAAAGWVAGF